MSGISPPMVHPGMLLVGAPAALAVTGLSASPRAVSIKISSRITPLRIDAKACLSMIARCTATGMSAFHPKQTLASQFQRL